MGIILTGLASTNYNLKRQPYYMVHISQTISQVKCEIDINYILEFAKMTL